ncbi:MAG TPA: hypothetical protein VMT26_02735 [Candidatus Bathyarchaeia archaeon]|nr:hypothetical protein [Candidatus Bathyarchaeia archaeon]
MNKKGQFSIIAALFVAVILIATVMVTYSTILNSSIQEQSQVMSAIDETNYAIKQILGFTVGYYGSVLQVTGNTSYARILALQYLKSGLVNIANMHPQWGNSFDISKSDLHTDWYTNTSYSTGNLAVNYSLTGLGISGITYETSCELSAQILNTTAGNQACLSMTKDDNEPLINLGRQNFKFYHYASADSTWELINATTEPTSFANGTYLIDIPPGVDPYSYLIQVEDQRGIIVVASSFSRYTCTPKWSSASSTGEAYVDNDVSDVDFSPDVGTHSSFTAEKKLDGVYDTLTEAKTDFVVKKGTFTKATSTGSQVITGVGFQPKAIIFYWTRQTSYGELAGVRMGYGYATNYGGTYQNCGVAFASDDNAGTSNTGRRNSVTYSIIVLSSGDPTMSAQARITSFDSDGFTLNWQTNEARADIIQYIALGGADLTARVGSFSLSTSSGTQDVTGVGFQPDFSMFLWTFTESADTSTNNAEIGMGFAKSSTMRGALVSVSRDGRSTTQTHQQQRTDSCILLLNPSSGSGAQDAIVDFSQFLSDGFRLSKSDAPAASTPIFYLALKGGYYSIGSFDSQTSTGTQDITGVGFQPKLVMLATQGRSATTSIGTTSELSFGTATSSTERSATWFEDTNNITGSDNEMETLNTKILQWRDRTAANTFTLRGSADFTSFLPDGFRISWSNVEATGRQIIYVAFGGHDYQLDLEAQWTNINYNGTIKQLAIYDGSTSTENLKVDVWHSGSWHTLFTSLTNGWNNISVSSYLDSSTFTIRYKGTNETSDTVQNSWRIDAALLYVWPVQDLYSSVQNATIVTEFLQNGTMRWLGQNLQLATQAVPIPPVPVKGIHVNETINGVNRQVPFQIEDWASDYTVPLGLTNNASVFNSRTMLVFLMNSKASKITIWWDGDDDANQTSYAYTDRYFTGDDPTSRLLTNGMLRLQFSGGFTLTSTIVGKSTTCTATFMRINSEASTYGATESYVIYHGVVRDIIQQESEWTNGADNCPDLYAHVVITLPANATYYTYKLRLMFVQTTQTRSITDLCPIKLTVSTGQPQTENGTASGFPIVSNSTGTYYNQSAIWMHHWSQIISSGNKGAGIMFTDNANYQLYAFDTPTTKTGAIKTSGTTTIELLPVTRSSVSFTSALDVTWVGAVATFDGGTPVYTTQSGLKTGLWVIVEYPPTMTVSTRG